MTTVRNYEGLAQRVEGLPPPASHQILGDVDGFPIYCVRVSTDASLPVVYVNGGTHGDEPAGVEAALVFLEAHSERWLDRVQFDVVPCLNPYGYVHNTRLNGQEMDINWAYKRDDVPEIQLIRDLVCDRKFMAIVDFHEDWESPGFYMYEQFRGLDPPGQIVVRRVSEVCPLNRNSQIEQEVAKNGVIYPNMESPKRRKGEGIPIGLFQEGYTDYLVTLETPSAKEMEVRVQAHITALETILDTHCRT